MAKKKPPISGIQNVNPQSYPPLPFECNKAINEARQSDGRFKIVVLTADEDGTIHLHRTNGEAWQYDWHLRATKLIIDDMLGEPLPKKQ